MLNPTFMPFKIDTAPESLSRLTGFTLLQAEGPEAGAFLQAQTMNDVAALAPGHWHWNGWLTPKGRVVALFALLRAGDQRYLLVLPDFPAAELQPLLQRYVFRSKVKLSVPEELACAAVFGDALGSSGHARGQAVPAGDSGWALDMGGDQVARHLALLPASHPALASIDAEASDRWRAQDIAHGLPRLAIEQREAWTPQMLSLERLQAFSVKKGCYPGQEVVARTHFLGQAKRGLVRLQGQGLAAGERIVDGKGQALGELVCSDATGTEALAVLPVDAPRGDWSCRGRPVLPLPLLAGLQR